MRSRGIRGPQIVAKLINDDAAQGVNCPICKSCHPVESLLLSRFLSAIFSDFDSFFFRSVGVLSVLCAYRGK